MSDDNSRNTNDKDHTTNFVLFIAKREVDGVQKEESDTNYDGDDGMSLEETYKVILDKWGQC